MFGRALTDGSGTLLYCDDYDRRIGETGASDHTHYVPRFDTDFVTLYSSQFYLHSSRRFRIHCRRAKGGERRREVGLDSGSFEIYLRLFTTTVHI